MKPLNSKILAICLIFGFSHNAFAESYMEKIQRYLEVTEQIVEITATPDQISYLAIEGIVEVYEQDGDLDQAVEELKQLKTEYADNQTILNMIRLKLRDIYKDSGQKKLALEELRALLRENAQ